MLARAVHLLTLGSYAWLDEDWNAFRPGEEWRELGGGGRGSVFYRSQFPPCANNWVANVLLAKPEDITDNEWYTGEDNMLLLLRRLADDGGCVGSFKAQDQSIRSGAAWICDNASKCSAEAAALFGKDNTGNVADVPSHGARHTGESDLERRKREARERAMQKVQANAARFAEWMESGGIDSDQDEDGARGNQQPLSSRAQNTLSSVNDEANGDVSGKSTPMEVESQQSSSLEYSQHSAGHVATACADTANSRLLRSRPQCIIGSRCNNEDSVLALCGFVQPSVVLKGGGGPPTSGSETGGALSSVSRLVGTHVTLCGHAVHSSCCESYLKTVSLRDDRFSDRLEGSKRGEFRCPLCQRLSNCLVPFIDVGSDWADQPIAADRVYADEGRTESTAGSTIMEIGAAGTHMSLHEFLETSKWWFSRNETSLIWDGRCSIAAVDDTSSSSLDEEGRKKLSAGSLPKKLRRSVRSFGKKDLFSAWGAVFKAPRFVRRKNHSGTKVDSDSTARSIHGHNISFPPSPGGASEDSSATDVWRKLMDQVAEVSHRADLKRLGEKSLLSDYGEFRHYLVEKAAYNVENRAAGKELVDVGVIAVIVMIRITFFVTSD